MNELDANIVVDGQKSVAVVNMGGEIVKDGGEVDATCVIETAQGRQKVVKTYLMGGGGGGGGSTPTLTWYTNNTGYSITIADTSAANLVKVYKNGLLLEPTADYCISGTTLTLVTALVVTDKITTEVF